MSAWINIGIVLLLILLEGLFVAAELSLVSLRESQVSALAEKGRRGRAVARLTANPNRFLSAVQLGVTLTALLSSAFGAITLSDQLGTRLRSAGLTKGLADALGFLVVTVLITFVTLVIGELAPKRLALQRTEGIAQAFAPVLDRIARGARPVIWALSKCTDGVVRLLGGDPNLQREEITEDELRGLVAAHEGLSADERRIVDEVFAAAQRDVVEVMVPRTEVSFLDAGQTVAAAIKQVAPLPHSRFPVVRGSQDDIVGFVHIRDLASSTRRGLKVSDLVREVKVLPASKPLLAALSEMRREGAHLAVVVDEYGGTAGIVTLEDLIEEVVGDIRDEYDTAESASDARTLRGGDVEVDGRLNLEDFCDATGVRLPEGPYETAAGWVVNRLGHLPRVGEAAELSSTEEGGPVVRLTVSRVEGRRVARLRVRVLPPAGSADAADHEPSAHEPTAHEPTAHEPTAHEPTAHEPTAQPVDLRTR